MARAVRFAHRSRAGVRATEAALLGLAAGLLCLAASVESGGSAAGTGPWIVAGVAATCAGLGWWLEHRCSAAQSAKDLDALTSSNGALLTAFECELEQRGAGLVGRALVARVADRLEPRTARRLLSPSLAVPVGAPLVAIAALALALERARDLEREASPTELVAGLVGALNEAGGGEALGLDRDQQSKLGELLRRSEELARELGGRRGDPRDQTRALEELDRSLAALTREIPAGEARDPLLERARDLADAAALALEEQVSAGDGEDSTEAREAAASGGQSPESAEGSAEELLTGTADGTMSGSPGADETPAGVLGSGPIAAETGVVGPAWWPPRHDALVSAWVDSRPQPETSPVDR